MKLPEDRIKAGGRALSESVLKVDVFLNHQVDPDLMQEVGKDFFEHFKDFGITRVFIIDDFLANGEAAMGASRLVDMAGATVASIGILIEKSFQNGRNRLLDRGFHVYSQARIARLGKGIIEFVEE